MSESKADPQSNVSMERSPALRFVVGVLMVCVVLFGWYYVRGTWATSSPTYPSSPEEAITSVIVRNQDGQNEIQTAVVMPVSVEDAWKILSDYGEWERLFSTIKHLDEETEPLDEKRHHVVSDVVTPLGVLKLDFIVTHEETSDGGYLAWWDAPTEELPVNRGEIRVKPQGPEKTLLVYSVHKDYRRYPQFVVYNMLLDHQSDLVSTLRDRITEAAREP